MVFPEVGVAQAHQVFQVLWVFEAHALQIFQVLQVFEALALQIIQVLQIFEAHDALTSTSATIETLKYSSNYKHYHDTNH